MRSLIYRSTSRLECQCDVEIIVCVDDTLTASGAPFLEATLVTTTTTVNACLETVYEYQIEYDEADLADPTHILRASEINGILCKGCLTTYIEYLISLVGP